TSMVQVPDLFVPMTMQPNLMPGNGYLLDRRGWGGISIVGRLADGVSHAAAASEIESIGQQLATEYPRTNESRAYAVTGFREAALPGGARGGVVQMSVLLLSIVAALWLVVCLNVANLFLARSMKRRQELALRLALGAGRARVTGQLVLEFMTIALVAGVVGMFLARVLAGAVATLPLPVLFDVSIDLRTVLFAGGIAVASGLLCAVVPAVAMSGTDPRTAAAPSRSMQPRRQRWPSRLLIVSQVTLSVILLFTTGLFVRTFANLTSADPGFDPENLLTAQFNPSLQGYDGQRIADFYERLTEVAASIPGVEAVAMADALPSANNFGQDSWFFQNATEPGQSSSVFLSAVSANFFPTMGIPIVDGRGFTEGDTPNQPLVVIVNEATARLIESRTSRTAVGQGMSMSGPGGPFLEVVGVVGDSRTGRVNQAPPFVYAAHPQALALGFGGKMVVMLKTSIPPASLAPAFRRAASIVDPNVSASNLITMDRFLSDLLATDRLTVTVLGISSILALFLVAVGVYGLLAYVVAQRTREFGIRLALGAGTANLKSIVLREALLLAGAGLLFGVVGALAVTRLISSFLVGVTTADPASMGVGITTVIGVTLAAAYVPARRAMRADPVVAMRAE
ncbi:MAG: FtsX-like permease family protein, partial [Gemmatimonadales bacterium]